MLTLSNGSKLPCKCEVMGQEARSQGLATFTTSPNAGVIPAKGTLDVEVTLQASRLGRIQLPLQIKVCCISCHISAHNQGCLWFLSQQSNTSVLHPRQDAWSVYSILHSKLRPQVSNVLSASPHQNCISASNDCVWS